MLHCSFAALKSSRRDDCAGSRLHLSSSCSCEVAVFVLFDWFHSRQTRFYSLILSDDGPGGPEVFVLVCRVHLGFFRWSKLQKDGNHPVIKRWVVLLQLILLPGALTILLPILYTSKHSDLSRVTQGERSMQICSAPPQCSRSHVVRFKAGSWRKSRSDPLSLFMLQETPSAPSPVWCSTGA